MLACHLVNGSNGREIDVESAKRLPLQHDSNCLPPMIDDKILSGLLCFKVEFLCASPKREANFQIDSKLLKDLAVHKNHQSHSQM